MKVFRAKFIENWNKNLDGSFIPDLRPYDPIKHEIDNVFNVTCIQNYKVTHHFKCRIVYLQQFWLVELLPGISYITFGMSPELTRKKLSDLYVQKIEDITKVKFVYIIYEKLQNLIV